MRVAIFDSLQPVCPICLYRHGIRDSKLHLVDTLITDRDHVIQGLIRCENADCCAEFPIVDGIPILVRDVPRYVSDNLQHIISRDDLTPTISSLIGDCCGQGTLWETTRQHLSCYGWDHFGEYVRAPLPSSSMDSFTGDPEPHIPGSIVTLLNLAIAMKSLDGDAPILDIGSACGRSTIEIARRTTRCTLGIDMNFSMLRFASRVLRTGGGMIPLRHLGMVYNPHPFELDFTPPENVDFWAVDILEPPFGDSQFGDCFAFNVLDAVRSPIHLLESMNRLLSDGSTARLSCPYDWSVAATPVEGWFGGHSQRANHAGDGPTVFKMWLESRPQPFLRLLSEQSNVPWKMRLHARSQLHYSAHLFCLAK